MSYREKSIQAEGAPSVSIKYGSGRFEAAVTYYRTQRSGNSEDVVIRFVNLDPSDLRCPARSLRHALNPWSADWHATDKEMRGEE